MALDPAAPSSRRVLLAASLGAAAASVAGAIVRPSPANAVAVPVYLDQNNPSSLETSIETSASIGSVFIGSHLGTGNGLYGYSSGGNGVYGQTASGGGAGVSGNASAGSGTNFGVWGQSSSTTGRGLAGRAFAGSGATYGVHAQSDSTSGTGVYGVAAAGSGETIGVKGEAASPSGTGVYGRATSSLSYPTTGVHGQSDSPIGRGGDFSGGDLGIDAYAIDSGGTAGVRGTGSGTFTAGVIGYAEGSGAYGVHGVAASATGATAGVRGHTFSPDGAGVSGYAALGTGATRGVVGHVKSPAGTGVQGYSGASETVPAPSPKTGVYGYAAQDSNARGVFGKSTLGRGVYGTATTGVAGYFATPKPADAVHSGIALQAVGRVKFDRCAGVATFALNATSVPVTPGIDLTSSSAAIAVITGASVGVSVVRTSVNATLNTFTVHLSGPATAAGKVAWHVFG